MRALPFTAVKPRQFNHDTTVVITATRPTATRTVYDSNEFSVSASTVANKLGT